MPPASFREQKEVVCMKHHPKESLYFGLRVIFSAIGLVLLFAIVYLMKKSVSIAARSAFSTFIIYIAAIILYLRFFNMVMIGYLRGNGIRINEQQFPEVYMMIQEIKNTYRMKTDLQVFLIQEGGALNAYAARFVGKNYVAIYADVFEQVGKDSEVLKFILAHEMAHVQERHVQKMFWTGLSFYVPFLAQAYSRACEYTCDMNGYVVAREGARKGLAMLAAGKHLYRDVNIEQYVMDYQKNNSFAVKLVEKLNSHPNLPKRIEYLEREGAASRKL